MNTIIQKQNEPKYLKYLAAQRVAYSQCKLYQYFDLTSIIVAITSPMLALLFKTSTDIIAAIGVIWTILYLIAYNFKQKKSEQGAKIQEQFDVELYNLEWNKILCKRQVPIDIINSLSSLYSNNSDLFNWYSLEIDTNLPKNIAIVLCQRINFSWELSLRKKYISFLVSILVFYYAVFFLVTLALNIGLYEILKIISPSLPFLGYGVQTSLSLKAQAKAKDETLADIDNILEEYRLTRAIPNESKIRQIQDVIYIERSSTDKIPDWFYKRFKSKDEFNMDETIRTIKNNF